MNVRNCRYNFLKSFAGHLKIHFSTAIYIRKRSEAVKMSILRASILICTLKTKIFKIIPDPFRQVYQRVIRRESKTDSYSKGPTLFGLRCILCHNF